MQGIGEQLIRGSQLHHLAEVHNADTVGEVLNDAQVMGDEQNRQTQLLTQVVQQVDDLRLNGNIQSGDGLVGDQQLGVHDDRTGDADTLTLATGELVGITTCVLANQTDQLQHLVNLLVQNFLVPLALDHQTFGDDLLNGHTGVQRGDGILENHLNLGNQLGLLSLAQLVLVFCHQSRLFCIVRTAQQKAEIASAKRDNTHVDKDLITQIQMIFQDPIASLDPRMTVKEIISEGLVIQGERNQEVLDQKVYEMLELVGLVREHASRYPHEFSGGQRQRIGVARSIIMNPELIIADEPVSALDVSVQAQVINLLNELRQKLGLTILFIAHDLSVVKYFSDRIGVMYFGKMVELASSDELFKHPLHPYTRSLLSAIPLPDPEYEKTRQRITYNPLAEHDYTVDKPSFREIAPGHFVMCNDAEEAQYRKMMEEA